MIPIQAPMKPDDSGESVANLQAALVFLFDRDVTLFVDPQKMPTADQLKAIREALISEASIRRFDKATRAMTLAFQQRQGLPQHIPGVVDQITADALNDRLRQTGALDEESTLAVKGRVFRAGADEPQPAVRVRAFATHSTGETTLGEAESNADGIYRIDFPSSLVRGASVVVRAYRPDGSEMGSARWTATLESVMAMDIVVAQGEFIVRGRVIDGQGRAHGGLVVIAYDRDMRRWQELGRALTTEDGVFEIEYSYESFRQAEGKVQPELDLVLQIMRRADGEALEPLHVHEEPRPVPPVVTVDVVIPTPTEPQPSEFQRVSTLTLPLLVGQGTEIPQHTFTAVLPPRYGDLPPAELIGSDVKFVMRETKLEPSLVQAWADAARMARELALATARPPVMPGPEVLTHEQLKIFGWNVFYGFVRNAQARDLDAVLSHNADTWAEWQRWNADGGWVDRERERAWFGIVQALERLRRLRMADPVRNPSAPLARVLDSLAIDLPADLTAGAADVFATHGTAEPEAYFKLAPDGGEGFSKEAVAVRKLVRGIRLHALTGGDASLMKALAGALDSADTDGHGLEPLARASRKQWGEWCGAVAQPAASGSSAALPWQLQARVERIHPGEALAARLAEKSLPLAAEDAELLHAAAKAEPQAVAAILAGQVGDAVAAIPEGAHDLMRNLGRYLKLGFTLEAGSHLWAAGVKSPGAMTSLGLDVIRGVLGDTAPAAYIAGVMQQAQAMVASSTALFNAAAGSQTMPLGLHKKNPPVSAAVSENLPTLRVLFGDLDECLCRPCESVLGLPAYLADLLTFLKKIPAHKLTAGTALQELRSRRPDIPGMQLGCELAEKEVQHIDIEIEVLQRLVGTNAESTLAAATYPWTLPYARAEAELHAWLDHAGVDRAEWMAELHGRLGDAAHVTALAAQRLGLSLASWSKVATAASNNEVWRAYGFANSNSVDLIDPASGKKVSGTPEQLLSRVSILLTRSGLELEDLLRALQTRFVLGAGGSGNTLNITGLDGCKTSEMLISGLSADLLDRLHRFARLWRALSSVPMPVLDSALEACAQPAALDFGTVLVRLSRLVALQRRLGIGLDVLLSLFKSLHEVRVAAPDLATQSAYASVFRAQELAAAQRAQFPDDPTSAAAFGAASLSAAIPAIALVMRCSPQALTRWVLAGSTANTTTRPAYLLADTWDYASLTALYRRQVLAEALELTPGDFTLMCAMTGAWPLQQTAADAFCAQMETLLDALQVHRLSGLTHEESAHLLLPLAERQGVPEPQGLAPDWAGIKAQLLALRVALLRAPRVTVDGDDAAVLRAKREALETLAVWIAPDSLRIFANALKDGVPANPADLPPLTTALSVPVPGLLDANGDAPVFLMPPETDALLRLPTEQERLQSLHDRIRELQLQIKLRESLVGWSKLPENVVDSLLARDLPVDTTDTTLRVAARALLSTRNGGLLDPQVSDEQAAGTTALVDWMHRLQRCAWVINKLGVSDGAALLDSMRLTQTNGASGPLPFSLITLLASSKHGQGRVRWAEWRSLLAMVWMLGDGTVSKLWAARLLRDLGAAGNAATDVTWKPLADAWSVAPAALRSLLIALMPWGGELIDPWHWWRARQLVEQAARLKLELAQFVMLCDPTPDAKTAEVAKAMALSANKSTAPKVEDQLKAQWRDALLAHATASRGKTVEELYAYHLIDMQMAPCMKTTPILQAIASVQQFVHRIFFGLETGIGARPGASLDEVRQQWAWMSQYRVWEANRKVFLFPENWLLPELRDDKSECFKAMEAALAQPEVTNSEAEQAFSRFLDDVAQTGRIHVLGMFEDVERDHISANAVLRRNLHQIGRTPHPPYRYYWRLCRDFGMPTMEWSPWRLIDLDIQGDHVLPFVLNGDLHVGWPIFEREAGAAPGDALGLKMAWSRLVGLRWSGVEISRDALTFAAPPLQDERSDLAFRCLAERQLIRVLAYAREESNAYVASATEALGSDQPAPRDQLIGMIEDRLKDNLNAMKIEIDKSVYVAKGAYPSSVSEVGGTLFIVSSVWIKVHSNDRKKSAYVQLQSNTSKFDVLLEFSTGGLAFPLGAFGRPAVWAPSGGTVPQLKLRGRIDWRGSRIGSELGGPGVDIAETNGDTSRTVSVTLVINPSSALTLSDLGIKESDRFLPVAEFRLMAGGSSELISARPNEPVLPMLSNCKSWMNGYQGTETTIPIRLPAPSGMASNIEPFKLPLQLGAGFFSTGNFWIVAAASNDESGGRGALWHYFDGNDACLIDSSTWLGSNGLLFLLASSYTDAAFFRAGFAKDPQALVAMGNAPIYFSADGLPQPSSKGDTYEWQQQRQGMRGFDLALPYGSYSWEIFFHAPLLIAQRLSQQGRYAEAEPWLRMVLDPTSGETGMDATRFLRFRPFRELDAGENLRESLEALAKAKRFPPAAGVDSVAKLVQRWRQSAFMPFAIARGRPLAFLWRTVFTYLDHLLGWADDLYRMDTRESINEATQLYALASQMLGRRPKLIKGSKMRSPITYDQVELWWDDFANVWIDSLSASSAAAAPQPTNYTVGPSARTPDVPLFGALYFCMPMNPKIVQYWDRVEERLFNIRHCRNIEGVQRDLPLTEAPIDPELLVRATAAGLDIGDVVRGLYAPPLAYRYQILHARALDLANEARSLAAGLLSALEKRDAEQLSKLRSSNELDLLERVRQVRILQRNESEEAIKGLLVNRDTAERRFRHLQRLMGKSVEPPARNQTLADERMLSATSARQGWGFSEGFGGTLGMIESELKQIDHLGQAHGLMIGAGATKVAAGLFHSASAFAEFARKTELAAGLKALGTMSSTVGDAVDIASKAEQSTASREQLRAGHTRRRDEWAHQANQVLAELRQIDRQLVANEIRRDIASKELENQQAQIQESRQIDEFLRSKFSNADLYQWMHGELAALVKSTYRLALDTARRAENAAARELGLLKLDIIRNDHWGQRRSGLLAPEQLIQDLKRLELSFLERNRREHEMTKHISLRMLDPQALLRLMTERTCEFKLPEWLFDMDVPGHYLRRLKSISLSVPCVAGPYASVNCKLTLLKSFTRISSRASAPYARDHDRDDHPDFEVKYSATESIVTSSGRDDSGLFETNLRDDRYLPFEHAGAESEWRLELMPAAPQFDPTAITDVIVHVRYTARDGGDGLRIAARESLIAARKHRTFTALMSLRHDFSAEWAKWTSTRGSIDLPIGHNLLPYWLQGQTVGVRIDRWNGTDFDIAGSSTSSSPASLEPGKTVPVRLDLPNSTHDDDDVLIRLTFT